MSRLRARLRPSPAQGGTASQRGISRPRPETITQVVVEFLVDEVPLTRAARWKESRELIGSGIASCIRNLQTSSEALLLSLSSSASHRRKVGGRTLKLRSEELVYLDYVKPGLVSEFAWRVSGTEDREDSQLLFRSDDRMLDLVVSKYWDWYSFSGFLVPTEQVESAMEWPFRHYRLSPQQRLRRELRTASVFFEDWADATGLRLSSQRLSQHEIAERIRLPAINDSLRQTDPTS